MSAIYWVGKHISDPFRQEPRNVGVIVRAHGEFAARFLGERDGGQIDGRSLKNFLYPDVYRQWIAYWRARIESKRIDEVVSSATPHFFVQEGGEVADIGQDTAKQVCDFLFGLLVTEGWASVELDYVVADDAVAEKSLGLIQEIQGAFEELRILQDGNLAQVQHPIVMNEEVKGAHTSHSPAFVQRNGHLMIYEVVDFSRPAKVRTKERAGWAAYMFSDIRNAQRDLEAYAIIRSEADGKAADALTYARDMLAAESNVVNWTNERERTNFLESRKKIALSL